MTEVEFPNLMEQVYRLLTAAYASSASGEAPLAFEVGKPISRDMFVIVAPPVSDPVAAPPASSAAPPSPGAAAVASATPADAAHIAAAASVTVADSGKVPASAAGAALPPLSAALGVQHTSEMANAALRIVGNAAERSGFRSVSGVVELLLDQASPISADALADFARAKFSSEKSYKDQALGSLDGLLTFHPVRATPADWYDPAVSGNWTPCSVGPKTAPPPPPAAPPPVPFHPPVWRVLPPPMHPIVMQPLTATHPVFSNPMMAHLLPQQFYLQAAPPAALHHFAGPAPAIHPRGVFVPPPPPHVGAVNASMAHVVAPHSVVMIHPPVPAPIHVAPATPLLVAHAAAAIVAAATPQAVQGSAINVGFEHCIVQLAWPWFPQELVLMRDWFIPGYPRGGLSRGTGAGDDGDLPVLPNGFVVIRNLTISGTWSDADRSAIAGAPSLDTFSLTGRHFDAATGTLTCPGMQIIGWFYEPLPVLPPAADVSLTAVSTPAASAPAPADAASTLPSAAATIQAVPPAIPPTALPATVSAPMIAAAPTGAAAATSAIPSPATPATVAAPLEAPADTVQQAAHGP